MIVGLLLGLMLLVILLLIKTLEEQDHLFRQRKQIKKAFYAAGRAQEALTSLLTSGDLCQEDRAKVESVSERIQRDIKDAFND